MPVTIRTATPDDAPEVFRLIRELAVYEKLDGSVRTDERGVRDAMESDTPRIFVLLAEEADTRRAVGFALYFFTFSTFEGAPTLYLEDLYVEPSSRGTGLGSRFLSLLARAAREQGCRRMEWTALDWNASARTFYENLGAVPMNDWSIHRLDAEGIETMAKRGTDEPVGRD
ncbi:MAG: N-acetyltransferase family protein [Spirochaetota bacterium]